MSRPSRILRQDLYASTMTPDKPTTIIYNDIVHVFKGTGWWAEYRAEPSDYEKYPEAYEPEEEAWKKLNAMAEEYRNK